jgi:hypothetical protein
MTFFNGPLDHLKERLENRDEYFEYIKQIGMELRLLATNYNTQFSSIFDPIPYTELPKVCF